MFISALDMCCHGYGQGFSMEIIIFVHQDGGDSLSQFVFQNRSAQNRPHQNQSTSVWLF